VTTFIINMTKRHPTADRPLINYSVAFLMAPTTILGTVFGIMLFIVFPQWFILILLVAVLGITDYRTIVKALELHRTEESESSLAAQSASSVNAAPEDHEQVQESSSKPPPTGGARHGDSEEDERTSLLRGYNGGDSPGSSSAGDDHDSAVDADAILFKESRTPVYKIMALLFLWLSMLLLVMIRGGGEAAARSSAFGIVKCSWQFALLTVAIAIVLCTGAAAGLWMQRRRTAQLKQAGIPPISGDIQWTPLKFIGFVCVGCFAGTCAGFLGIGSGMINVPYMLEVGMQPQVAAATSSFIIIFTAMSTVVQYIIAGVLPLKSAAWYGSVGLISALLGQFAISKVVQKYKKASIISFLLAGLITVSAIGLITMAGTEMADAIKHKTPGYWSFNDYCAVEEKPGTANGIFTAALRWAI